MNRMTVAVSCLVGLGLVACGAGVASEPMAGNAVGSSAAALSVPCPANVPAALAVGPDQELFRAYPAEGVQIYACTATGWVFESPDALLLKPDSDDGEGERVIVGHHYAGPTWEYKDHSLVVGARVAGVPSPLPGTIPWLLLKATAHGPQGKFSEVTSIQRLDTVGGIAPATGCDATTVGAKARVPYTATYYFYRLAEKAGRSCP
jgi:hypothetical protein